MTAVPDLSVLLLVGMLMVSALYHRFPWNSYRTVAWWRQADHAMIALFIAGTYGPVTLGAGHDTRSYVVLIVCWITAAAVNILWINHPRWLSVTIYLLLGWVALVNIDKLHESLSTPVQVLIVLGGLIYSAGAIAYAVKRPNISPRWFGFHEVFHAATIVAAGFHHVAIWLIILGT